MAKISKIRLPNGSEYDLGDAASLASEDVVKMNGNIPVVVDLEDDASTGTPVEVIELTDGTYKLMISDGNGNNVVEYAVHGTILLSVDSRGIVKSAHLETGVVKCDIIASSSLTANKILVSDSDKNIVSSGYEFDINTNNTSDTWLLVVKDGKIQHRLISSLADVSRAVKLKDYTDNNDTYLDYGSSAMADSNVTYVGAWDGYKLRAIKKEDMSVANAAWLRNYYPTRPTSANHQFGDGSLTHYKATSSMTTGKPANDAHIIHLAWDNKGGFDAQLAIFSNSNCFAQIRAQSNGTWGSWYYLIRGHAQANFSYAVTGIGKIADSNNFYATATSGNYYWGVAAWSDKRLKKNIKKSKVQALVLVNKIQLKEFDFIDDKFGNHESIGYVAQDLIEVIPEAVQSIPLSEDEDKEKYSTDKLYMVEDKHIIKYLVKAVQELTDIVNKQQIEIDELKNRVVALKEVIEY